MRFLVNRWNEQEIMGNLVATLQGPATYVLNVVPKWMLTSACIHDAMTCQFGFVANCDLVVAQLQHHRLKPDETLQELAQDIY